MITLEYLEQELWKSADILRSAFPTNDYHTYLFGLFFLKHLSDVFEERSKILNYKIDNQNLEWNGLNKFDVFVPQCCRWSYLQCVNHNIGSALNIASIEIEDHNPNLRGIFTSIDFENKYHSFGSEQYEMTLRQLIDSFSYLNLAYNNLENPDILGKACEYLIENLASQSGKKGSLCTPNKIRELLVHLLGIEKGMKICDPVCGLGGFLVASANYIKQKRLNLEDVYFYGQEINLEAWVIAKINLLLHGVFDIDIRLGDTIRDPQLLENEELILFDRVFANPPFNLKNWGEHLDSFDIYHRFRYGLPPKSHGDFAFIQHILATLTRTGKAAIIVSHGVLFRGGQEGLIRQRILEEDLIEAVIGLAPNLFYETGIPASILIFNRNKPEERKNKVLFIDASSKYHKIGNKNHLQFQDITDIITSYQAFTDEEGYAKVASLEGIANNDYILNINRYVLATKTENEKIDIKTEIIKLRELETERAKAENDMNRYLHELGVKL